MLCIIGKAPSVCVFMYQDEVEVPKRKINMGQYPCIQLHDRKSIYPEQARQHYLGCSGNQ